MPKETTGRLLNIALIFFFLIVIYMVKWKILYVLGGSTALIFIFSTNILIYLVNNKYNYETSIFNTLILLLIFINILSYYEPTYFTKKELLFNIYFMILVLIIVFFMLFVKGIVKLQPENILSKKSEISSKLLNIISICITSSLIFFVLLGSVLTKITTSAISLYSISISLLMMLIFLLFFEKKINIHSKFDSRIKNVLNRKIFFYLFTVVLIAGTAFEHERGNWLVWVGTIISLFFLFLVPYRILNYNIPDHSLREVERYADKI